MYNINIFSTINLEASYEFIDISLRSPIIFLYHLKKE